MGRKPRMKMAAAWRKAGYHKAFHWFDEQTIQGNGDIKAVCGAALSPYDWYENHPVPPRRCENCEQKHAEESP